MSDFKSRLKESQGQGSSFPKLPVAHTVEIKEDSNKEPEFVVYDKESKENMAYPAPIVGILIGTAMQASAYSGSLGKNGANYKSDFYIKNDNIIMFAPTAKGYEKVFSGTSEAMDAFLTSNGAPKAKKRQVLFVLTNEGLLAVLTNLSISIDQVGKFREDLQEKMIVLTPTMYHKDLKTVSPKAKEFLGKLANTNPPKFADITIGDMITEEVFVSWGADKVIADFTTWKKWKEGGGAATEVVEQKQDDGMKASWTPAADYEKKTNEVNLATKQRRAEEMPEDDLPF